MTDPNDVKSPLRRLKGHLVIRHRSDYSLAVGQFDNERVLMMRWNGDEESPKGNPTSRGLPTWFVVPQELWNSILDGLDSSERALARSEIAKPVATA